MRRYLNALEAGQSGTAVPSLSTIAHQLVEAINEVEAEGGNPHTDPAVLVLGGFIAFHTHSDVTSAQGFNHWLNLCRNNLSVGFVA
jgi:hypothetical protein